MKKLLLTLSLIGFTLGSALAQGTINPLNNTLTRFKIDINGDAIGDRNMTAADGMQFAVFYGPAGSTAEQLVKAPGIGTIGNVEGIMVGLPSVLALPGTEAGQVVSLQVRGCNVLGWNAYSWVGQITLGPAEGPGTGIWRSQPSGLNSLFPLVVAPGMPIVNCIPEPSTLALGALAGALLLFRVRQSTKAS